MPNTLAHIALHAACLWGIGNRVAIVPLILLSAIIPDVAWIVQRVVNWTDLPIDPYNLRAYAIVQASLFVSLALAVGCASLFKRWAVSFAILASGCLIHLLLDGLQIKWANGVSLLAPFNWKLFGWGLVWPEHPIMYPATLGGLLVFMIGFRRVRVDAFALTFSSRRLTILAAMISIYIVLPFALISGPNEENNHYIATLQDKVARPGRLIEIDRRPVFKNEDTWYTRTFAGEEISLTNFEPPGRGIYSLRGRFLDESQISVHTWHAHGNFRDIGSMVGLSLTAMWFFLAMASRFHVARRLINSRNH